MRLEFLHINVVNLDDFYDTFVLRTCSGFDTQLELTTKKTIKSKVAKT